MITDFASGSDKIDLSQIVLTDANAPADLVFRGAVGDDTYANNGTRTAYSAWTDTDNKFLYADTTGDGKADLKIQVSSVVAGDLVGVEANDERYLPLLARGQSPKIPRPARWLTMPTPLTKKAIR